MKRIIYSLSTLLFLVFSHSASSTLMNDDVLVYGALAETDTFYTAEPPYVNVRTLDGGADNVSAVTSNIESTTQAEAVLSGPIGAPVLRAYADASDGILHRATAFGIQRYLYNGANTTLTITGNFHVNFNDSLNNEFESSLTVFQPDPTDPNQTMLKSAFNFSEYDPIH